MTVDSGHAEGEDVSHGAVHWGYGALDGPDSWEGLSAEYETCGSVLQQSPVNIQTAMAESSDSSAFLNYGDTGLTITNNGHTIQVNYDAGSAVHLDSVKYQLCRWSAKMGRI